MTNGRVVSFILSKEKNDFKGIKREANNIKTIHIVFTLLGVKSH